MLFSVSYAGLWGQAQLGLEEFIDKAAELGYPAVELMAKRPHLSPLDWPSRRLRRLRRRAEAAGVDIHTLAAYTDFTAGFHHAEIPQVEMQIGAVEHTCRMAAELGAALVRVFTGYDVPGAGWHRQRVCCIDALRECGDRAAALGVAIGVQNHHDVAVGVDEFAALLAEVGRDNVRAMFDAWSIAQQPGVDLEAAARQMAPLAAQTTVADYERFSRFRYREGLIGYEQAPDACRAVPMGRGWIDYEAFFRGLAAGGFAGPVAYEMCSPLRGGGSMQNLDDAARESLQAIRRLIG
jgi:sugar phosphate isomerase/epimerase